MRSGTVLILIQSHTNRQLACELPENKVQPLTVRCEVSYLLSTPAAKGPINLLPLRRRGLRQADRAASLEVVLTHAFECDLSAVGEDGRDLKR